MQQNKICGRGASFPFDDVEKLIMIISNFFATSSKTQPAPEGKPKGYREVFDAVAHSKVRDDICVRQYVEG